MKRIAPIATALLFVLMVGIPPRADEFDPPPFQGAGVHDGEFGDLVEADCRSCHGSTVDRHHRLFGSLIPDPTEAPDGNPGELYGCLSCHAPDASSGGGGFLVERDCRVCHGNGDSNQPPVADPNGPYAGSPGQAVQFDGTGSSDPDGTIVAYDWDFGDGDTGTGASPSHMYAAAGDYTVALTVTDDDGLTDTATTSAAIEDMTGNEPPVADAGGPYTGKPNEEVQFDGTGSFDPDGAISAYFWEFGDGNMGFGESPTHAYASVGTYTVTLTVGDTDGELDSDTTTVEITDDTTPPPTGNVWAVRVPSSISPGDIEFQIEIEDFAGILWFDETFPGGQLAFGIGMESDDIIFWYDSLGALFYGMVDQSAGTMMGIVFDFMGDREHDTIFFAEQQPP